MRIPVSTRSVLAALLALTAPAWADSPHEVWAIDQSNSPGKTFGGTLYIWQGNEIQSHPESAVPEVVSAPTPLVLYTRAPMP